MYISIFLLTVSCASVYMFVCVYVYILGNSSNTTTNSDSNIVDKMHMISKMVYVHWLNNHAFTGDVNARPARVWQKSYTNNRQDLSSPDSLSPLFSITILTHIPAAVGGERWYSTGWTVTIIQCDTDCVCVCARVQKNGHVLKTDTLLANVSCIYCHQPSGDTITTAMCNWAWTFIVHYGSGLWMVCSNLIGPDTSSRVESQW
jgi:hypothetical protein